MSVFLQWLIFRVIRTWTISLYQLWPNDYIVSRRLILGNQKLMKNRATYEIFDYVFVTYSDAMSHCRISVMTCGVMAWWRNGVTILNLMSSRLSPTRFLYRRLGHVITLTFKAVTRLPAVTLVTTSLILQPLKSPNIILFHKHGPYGVQCSP